MILSITATTPEQMRQEFIVYCERKARHFDGQRTIARTIKADQLAEAMAAEFRGCAQDWREIRIVEDGT